MKNWFVDAKLPVYRFNAIKRHSCWVFRKASHIAKLHPLIKAVRLNNVKLCTDPAMNGSSK